MTDTTHTHTDACQQFLDNLDHWLAEELDNQQNQFMQAHQHACPDCALEARLASNIDSITQSLPPLQYPVREGHEQYPGQLPEQLLASRSAPEPTGFFNRLIATWRQPLVFVPTLALILVTGSFIQMQLSQPVKPQVIVVNGEEYTPEEVIQAAEDLELALQYLNKYSNYAARAVSFELQHNNPSQPAAGNDSDDPSI